jgi:hypothetical protein
MTMQHKNERMLGDKTGSFTGSSGFSIPGNGRISHLKYAEIFFDDG